MAKNKMNWQYGLAATALAGAGAAWLWRRSHTGLLPPVWRQALANQYGDSIAQALMERIERRYAALLAERPLPENRRLRQHVTQNILPGLALYQVLLRECGNDRQAALAEIAPIFRQWTLSGTRSLAVFKLLPLPFGLFRLAFGSMMKIYPPEGWDFEYLENSGDRVAFNATRCFYLKTLTEFGAPELTASFCKTDEVMARQFARYVKFVRPHTLGRGDSLCDFEYCRVG